MISFPRPDAEQFFRTDNITHFTVSKDEATLFFNSNINGKFNLWAMDLPNTYPYPLTFHGQNSNFVKVDPENRFLLTGLDQDGDENFQIYALPVEGGKPKPLLTGEKDEKYFFADLTEDGERLYYVTSKENPVFLDVRRLNLVSGEDELLIQGEGNPIFLDSVSPGETNLAFVKHKANTYIPGYVKQGDEHICLIPDEEAVYTVSDITFIEENLVLFVTNYNEEFSYLAQFDLEQRRFEPVLKLENESIMDLKWHKASRTVYIVTEKGVRDYLYAVDLDHQSRKEVDLPLENVQQLHLAESGTLYLLGRSATKPFNLMKKSADGEWEALTNNRVLGIPESDLVDPEVVTYASYDGKPIEALLFRAKEQVANGYTIFWPHGGPQAAERKFFRGLFQFLLGRGYHIFAPNFRGSTGYGSEFVKMVEGDWGEGPRLDCVSGIEWLFEKGICPRDKLFVVGGSYGGYMTLLLAGRHPEYFRAAVDIFGPSNLFTFIESVPDHWKPIMERWLGDPEKDKERLTKDSPITYLERMTKPMLVIQGANDPRVVKAESDTIVDRLKKQGTEVEYLVLDDEGHGFSRKENEIKVNRLIVDFLERHQ
ncbi:MAG TPA: S9 family peptidase [Bacillales bacterium]|nr:S9 family peptidase [Bacillales bacterium]